jgi:mono/diheme cytochrome c family protein
MRLRTAFFFILTTLLLAGCNFTLAADITPPPDYVPPAPLPTLGPLYPAESPDVQNGQSIYIEKCQPCHGDTGLGDGQQGKQLPVPVAALGLPQTARKASPARWFTVVSQGNIERYMPPFTSLSEQERWDVVAFALSMHISPEVLEQGKALFESKCAGCPTDPFTDQTRMSALSEDDLVKLVRAGGEGVTAFGADLGDDEAYALAAYLRALSFSVPAPATPTAAPATETPAVVTGSETPAAEATPLEGTPGAEATATAAVSVEGVGTVTGTVSNPGSASLPSGAAVTLRGYDHAQDSSGPKETLTLEGDLAADGTFAFENVELLAGRILLAEMEYQGVTYQSQVKTLDGTETGVALDPIMVYESNEDFSGLSLDQLHVAFDFGTGETMQVFEIYSFSNKTDQAIIIKTDGSEVPFIAIPQGAEDVGFEAGQDTAPFSPAKEGIALVPSEKPYSLIAFFSLPYNSKGTPVIQPLLLKTDSLSVFVPEGLKLRSDDLTDAGVQDMSGTKFHMYSGQDLAADSTVTFSLSGKPDLTVETTASSRQTLIYGAGALGLVLIGVGVWLYLRDRKKNSDDLGSSEEDEDEFEDADSVLDAILALDDLHRAKKIPDEAYQARRAELKEQLRDLESK